MGLVLGRVSGSHVPCALLPGPREVICSSSVGRVKILEVPFNSSNTRPS